MSPGIYELINIAACENTRECQEYYAEQQHEADPLKKKATFNVVK
jgi:hypothetical protein